MGAGAATADTDPNLGVDALADDSAASRVPDALIDRVIVLNSADAVGPADGAGRAPAAN